MKERKKSISFVRDIIEPNRAETAIFGIILWQKSLDDKPKQKLSNRRNRTRTNRTRKYSSTVDNGRAFILLEQSI